MVEEEVVGVEDGRGRQREGEYLGAHVLDDDLFVCRTKMISNRHLKLPNCRRAAGLEGIFHLHVRMDGSSCK